MTIEYNGSVGESTFPAEVGERNNIISAFYRGPEKKVQYLYKYVLGRKRLGVVCTWRGAFLVSIETQSPTLRLEELNRLVKRA